MNATQVTLPYKVEGVTKRGGNIPIIEDISFKINEGEKVAVLGSSGVGKTTLLRLMAGELSPDNGVVSIYGNDSLSFKQGRGLSRVVGLINQQYDLVEELSVINNVLAGNLGRWGIVKSLSSLLLHHESDIALRALATVDLSGKENIKVSKLSGGEKQRVAIARLIVQNPSIVLADEPVSALDPARAEEVMDFMLGYVDSSGKTLVTVLHSLDFTRRYFDRVIGLRQGGLYFDLPTASLTEGIFRDLYI